MTTHITRGELKRHLHQWVRQEDDEMTLCNEVIVGRRCAQDEAKVDCRVCLEMIHLSRAEAAKREKEYG